ncbi:MAG: DNA polymerase [Candidatus Nanopelagicales bacterium]
MAVDFDVLTDLDQIEKLFDKLAGIEDGFGFDIETGYSGPPREKFSLHPETAFITGISYSGHPSWARYTPLRHDDGGNAENVKDFAYLLAKLLGSGFGVPHNGLFELRHIAKFLRENLTEKDLLSFGLKSNGYYPIRSDSMVELWALGRFRMVGLKAAVLEVFGHKMTEFSDLFPDATAKQNKAQRFNTLPLDSRTVSYACEDSAWTLGLHRKHFPLVKDRLMFRVDMQIIPILAKMEDRGIQLDWATMSKWDVRAQAFADAMRAEIMQDLSEITGEAIDINLSSSPQVSSVLYGKMGLRTTKLTDSGGMSTDAKALAGLAKKNPAVQRILEWRELRKLSGSYLTKYPRDFNYAEDGRGHPSHQSCAVVSGRFAVSDPAYQQLPKKYFYKLKSGEEFAIKFRNIVVAAPHHYLIGFDYSQVELRVLAGLSGEPALVKAFNEEIDVHRMTSALMFGIPVDEVTDEQRSIGKTINFSLLYGQGPKGMAERMGISIDEAKAFLQKYFAIYSSVKSWVDKQTRSGVANGRTLSKFGRVHPIWALESDKPAIRANGERLCVNAPVQGGAADVMRIAMVRCDRAIEQSEYADRIHMIMNIHDALVFETHHTVPPQAVIDLVQPEVVFPIEGWPNLRADWEVGVKWGDMHALKLDEQFQIIIPTAAAS